MAVDATDLRIVTEIQRNGRITNQALADRVGLSPSPCLQRFRKLEGDGVIGPFIAQVDLDRLCPNVMVLTTVSLDTAIITASSSDRSKTVRQRFGYPAMSFWTEPKNSQGYPWKRC